MQRQAQGLNPALFPGQGRGAPGAGRGMPAGARGMPAGAGRGMPAGAGRGMPAGGRGAGRGRGAGGLPGNGKKWGNLNPEQKSKVFSSLKNAYDAMDYPEDLQHPMVTNAYVMQIGKGTRQKISQLDIEGIFP